jgi:hypothetical protein
LDQGPSLRRVGAARRSTRTLGDEMNRSVRRIGTRAAYLMGYVPMDQNHVERLMTTRGEFRRSTSERLHMLIRAAIFVATASFVAGVAYTWYRHDPSRGSFIVPSVLALMLAAVALLLIRRSGVKYVFEHGHLDALAANGRMIWREDLAGLVDLQCYQAPYMPSTFGELWLTLRWRDRKRRIECYESLRRVLFGSISSPNNALEQTREG